MGFRAFYIDCMHLSELNYDSFYQFCSMSSDHHPWSWFIKYGRFRKKKSWFGSESIIIFLQGKFGLRNGNETTNILYLIEKTCLTLNEKIFFPWWRHQMETFSALLAICAGNSPVPGEFPAERPVTRSFDVFFDMSPKKGLRKQSWCWWFETLSCP